MIGQQNHPHQSLTKTKAPSAALFVLALFVAINFGCGRSQPKNDTTAQFADDRSPSVQSDLKRSPDNTFVKGSSPDESAPAILDWYSLEALPDKVALFDHVFWEPDDTLSLRKLLRTTDLVKDKTVLEIGTGTGIVALCCVQAQATQVVATDINPWAIRNCRFNATQLGFADRIQLRQVSQKTPDAWSVVGPAERFDVIVSNPPWELGKPTRVEDFAFYDPEFQLMKSLVKGLPDHLQPGGRAFLAYGCVSAIKELKALITAEGMTFTVHDDRQLDSLAEKFLPGMLIEIHFSD